MKRIELAIPKGPFRSSQVFLTKYLTGAFDTLKIGTLDSFRAVEVPHGDPMEGRIEGISISGKRTFTSEEFNRTTRNGPLDIQARDGIVFGPLGVYTDDHPRRISNCFVFCCSYESENPVDADRAASFRASHAGHILDPHAFARHVAKWLPYCAQIDPLSTVYKYHFAPVRYTSRRRPDVAEINNLDLFVYQKDPRFRTEQEVRFSWIIYERATLKQVYVPQEPAFVPVPKPDVFAIRPLGDGT